MIHCDMIMSRLPANNLLPVGVKRRPSTSASLPFRGLAVCHGLLSPAALKRTRKNLTILSAGTGQLLAHCTAHARLLCRCSDSLLDEHALIRKLLHAFFARSKYTCRDCVYFSIYYIIYQKRLKNFM